MMTKGIGALALLLTTAFPAFAFEDGKLLIWVGANRDEAALQAIGDKFAADLGVAVNQINLKAKTNELLGHLGRGEGIAVHAVALIYLA